MFFDPEDGVLIERGTANLDSGRRPKPVKNALARTSATAAGMDERRSFVPAFVAGEPQKWQSYLRLGDSPVFLARFAAGFFGADLVFGLALAPLAPADLVAGLAAEGRATVRPSAGAL